MLRLIKKEIDYLKKETQHLIAKEGYNFWEAWWIVTVPCQIGAVLAVIGVLAWSKKEKHG